MKKRRGKVGGGGGGRGGVRSTRTGDGSDAAAAAREQAVRLLAASGKSAKALVERLERAGFSGEISRRAVESLVTHRLIDEEALGRAVVRKARRGGPMSRRLVRAKLIASGLDEELAERIVEEEMEGTDDPGEAVALVRRLLAGLGRGAGVQRRVYAAVARRGFDEETAERAVRTVMGRGSSEEGRWE